MGIDPYDFMALYSSIRLPFPPESIYYLIDGYLGFGFTHSKSLHRCLGIRPHEEAKALSLFARAYLRAQSIKTISSPIDTAQYLGNRLWLLRNQETKNASWGLSFPWRAPSKGSIPANSPTALITALAGLAFLELYNATNLAEYQDYAAELVGMEVEVTGTSLSDITVSAPTTE